MDIPATVNMGSCCNHSPPECTVARSASNYMHNNINDDSTFYLENKVEWNTGQERAKPESQVTGNLTCERPGEGAGWGLEGDPVIGCGALFISWGSAWGGRCGPVYESK